MRLADHSVSLKALPVNALIGLEQTTRFTGGHDDFLRNILLTSAAMNGIIPNSTIMSQS